MSLYSDYLRERTTDDIIENEIGFVSYRFINDGKSVFITDIYVKRDFRKSGQASALADDVVAIAKQRGCVEVLGSVVPSTRGSTDSLKVLLGYGMSLMSSANDFIMFRKDIV